MEDAKFDFDDALQFKILQLLIQDYSWARSVGLEIIEEKYFDNEIYGKIFVWIKYLIDKYQCPPERYNLKDCVDKVVNRGAISQDLQITYNTLIDRCYAPLDEATGNIDYIKDRALEFAKREKFRQGLEQSVSLLKMGPEAYEQAVPIMEKALSVGAGMDLGMNLKRDIINLPEILGKKYDKTNMISSGLKGLDETIGGGWIRGTLSLVGGSPGAGKSRVMAFFAAEALKKYKKVAIVTLELDEDETLANVASSLTKMTWWDIMDPDPVKKQEYRDRVKRIEDACNPNLMVKFYINKTISSQTIMAWLMRLKSAENFTPDLLIVDYMDLLQPIEKPKAKGDDSEYSALGVVCFDLIKVAKMFNIPVISGTQLGRAGWNLTGAEVISMASVSESAKKAFNCHNLITINRNPGEKELNKARLYGAKCRTGHANTIVYCNYDLGTCTLSEVPEYDPTETVAGAITVKETTK